MQGGRRRPLRAFAETDARERVARSIVGSRFAASIDQDPSSSVEAKEREQDIVNELLARKQGQNLIGPSEAEMHAFLRRHPG
jgi:hypothetical protein